MDNRLLKLDFKTSLSALADLLMPRVCLSCGRALTLRERFLCLPCSMDLPLTRFEHWEHNPMADKYNDMCNRCPEISDTSGENRGTLKLMSVFSGHQSQGEDLYEPYQRAAALIYYRAESGYSAIPRALKYRRDFAAGRHFAAMLGRRLAGSPLFEDVDLVVPVPLHWMRRLRRGYNQAEVIAREVARALCAARAGGAARAAQTGQTETGGAARAAQTGQTETGGAGAGAGAASAAFEPRLLRRTRLTKTQTRLGTEAKRLNVAGAFAVRRGIAKKWREKKNSPRHILLVDDVFTSGSTLATCHAALRTVFGPEVRISVATLAFAG